jgi:o-succinylbenzoate synthase
LRLDGVELRRIRMPLVGRFQTSFGAELDRDILLVRVAGDAGEGWGECVAPGDPLYSAEYADGAQDVLERHLLPRVFALPDVTAEAALAAMAQIKGHPMAKAAVEMALLDAELRARGVSFATHLGAVRDRVRCGVSIGIHADVPALLAAVERYLEQGYVRVKLKIAPGWDVEPVYAVRGRFGDDLLLQVDANCGYTPADIPRLLELDGAGLLLIEQPFPEDDLQTHIALAERATTPICLDETITSASVARHAIAVGACSIINIKSGRVGGLLESRRIHDLCAEAGVPVWCGGMLETGIGRAANVALAALPNCTLPGDTSASSRYWERDLITEPFELQDGTLPVPAGPGLGVEVDAGRLAEVTASVTWCPAR